MLGQLSGSTTAVLPLSSFVSCPDCFSMAILLMLFCTAAFAIIKKLYRITVKKSLKFVTIGEMEENICNQSKVTEVISLHLFCS